MGPPICSRERHAIMADSQGIPLKGIYFLKDSKKFAVIADLPPGVEEAPWLVTSFTPGRRARQPSSQERLC
jgi:hypothetical protein